MEEDYDCWIEVESSRWVEGHLMRARGNVFERNSLRVVISRAGKEEVFRRNTEYMDS